MGDEQRETSYNRCRGKMKEWAKENGKTGQDVCAIDLKGQKYKDKWGNMMFPEKNKAACQAVCYPRNEMAKHHGIGDTGNHTDTYSPIHRDWLNGGLPDIPTGTDAKKTIDIQTDSLIKAIKETCAKTPEKCLLPQFYWRGGVH